MSTKTEQRDKALMKLPRHLREPLAAYIEHRRAPGDFLRAVLMNDLGVAVFRADPVSLAALREIVLFIHWYAPSSCWGSRKAVNEWLSQGDF